MKHTSRHNILIIALLFATSVLTFAQGSSKIQDTINDIVNKYDEKNNVECITVTKGNGLELMKMMLNQEFGKSFMKGVTSVTIINYSDAPDDTCNALRKELDVFISLLEEFDLTKEESFADNDYVRCFASSSDSGTLSDFVVAIEKGDSKMLMYMAGKIIVE